MSLPHSPSRGSAKEYAKTLKNIKSSNYLVCFNAIIAPFGTMRRKEPAIVPLTCKFQRAYSKLGSPASSRGLTQNFSVLLSAIFLCRGVTGVCALLLCATFWADTSVCPYGRIVNLLCRVFLLLFERQKVNKGIQ